MRPLFNNARILEFRYLGKHDLHMDHWDNWSRNYEYPWVIHRLLDARMRLCKDDLTVHNTACGTGPVHVRFCDTLVDTFGSVVNSDVVPPEGKPKNYRVHNILHAIPDKFDAVVNVSVLEHLPPDERPVAMMSLWEQVKPGGVMLLTFDAPDLPVHIMEEWVNGVCADANPRLEWNQIQIVVLALEKRK